MAASIAGLVLVVASGAHARGSVNKTSVLPHRVQLGSGSSAVAVLTGSRGELWVLGEQASRLTVWKLSSLGRVLTTYQPPSPSGPLSPWYAALASDGSLWFIGVSRTPGAKRSEGERFVLGHMTSTGGFTFVPVIESTGAALERRK